MQKEMSPKQAFIHSTERAGNSIQYYLDTKEEIYMERAICYIRAAYILSKEMNDDSGD